MGTFVPRELFAAYDDWSGDNVFPAQVFLSRYLLTTNGHLEWSGINALLYYGPSLMRSIGLEGDTVMLLGSGFISIVQAIAVVPAIMYLDEWGRRPLLIRRVPPLR